MTAQIIVTVLLAAAGVSFLAYAWREHRLMWRETLSWGKSWGIQKEPYETMRQYRNRIKDRAAQFFGSVQ